MPALHPAEIRYSHLAADTEAARTKARRAASSVDRILDDLRHAIRHGNTTSALDLLVSVERLNLIALDALTPPDFPA